MQAPNHNTCFRATSFLPTKLFGRFSIKLPELYITNVRSSLNSQRVSWINTCTLLWPVEFFFSQAVGISLYHLLTNFYAHLDEWRAASSPAWRACLHAVPELDLLLESLASNCFNATTDFPSCLIFEVPTLTTAHSISTLHVRHVTSPTVLAITLSVRLERILAQIHITKIMRRPTQLRHI